MLAVQAEEMIHNIRVSFSELLESVDWMDDETRAKAKEKVRDYWIDDDTRAEAKEKVRYC